MEDKLKPNRKEDALILITRGNHAKVWFESDHWLVVFPLKDDELVYSETGEYYEKLAREIVLQGIVDYFLK